jgi:RNA polymerase sigma-70 factor (ECF subfamily)
MINIESNFADRLRSDDKKVMEEIFALFHARIFRFSIAYLKNEPDAYDLVQEVFIKIWESRYALKKDTNFEAYIFTIAKNAMLSLFRKRLTEQKYLDYLAQAGTLDNGETEEQTNFIFLKRQYEELIEHLPPKRKEIFLLSREKGLSNKEIALLKGISEKTVENQITKALVFFRHHLSSYGIWTALFYYLFIK